MINLPKLTGVLAALFLAASLVGWTSSPVRAAACNLKTISTTYAAGANALAKGQAGQAMRTWMPLAEAGLGPAQREIAKLYGSGQGVSQSPVRAALWSELAFRAGDKESRRLSRRFRSKLDNNDRTGLSDQVKNWTSKGLDCSNGKMVSVELNAADGKPPAIEITFDRRVKDDDRPNFKDKVSKLLALTAGSDPSARVYLAAIDEVELYNGNRYHRYVGWRANGERNIMRLASSNFEDQNNTFAARAILLAAKRRTYKSLPNSEFADPMERIYDGKKIFGSVYPDIRNGKFFSVIRQAFDMAKRLPADLQPYINIIDEIHYNPISKHFIRQGTLDSSGAYYNKLLSDDGQRLMFVRRDVRYSSALFFLRVFVHEGTHAVQDKRAQDYLRELNKIKREIAKLQQRGQGGSDRVKSMTKEMNDKLAYAKRWYQGIKTATGQIQDIEFECEATRHEIRAVMALDAPPDVMKSSGYLKLCPKAQRMIIQWNDKRRANRR